MSDFQIKVNYLFNAPQTLIISISNFDSTVSARTHCRAPSIAMPKSGHVT